MMKKGTKQSRHTRLVKTKRGRKRILVNPGIKKKTSKKGVITANQRQIFNHISDPGLYQEELGGAIDFDKKGRVENINIVPGDEFDVYLPTDYEVQYHTHPDYLPSPPTPDDVIAIIKNNKQQAEIVFQDGKAFVIVKTAKSKKLSGVSDSKLHRDLSKLFYSARGYNWESKWKKSLEDLGFIVYIDNDVNKPLNIQVTPKEPKNKPKRVKHSWA